MNHNPNFYFKNDLTDGGSIRCSLRINRDIPSEVRQRKYRELQECFAIGLYDAMQHCRHPVVVELLEDIKHHDIDIITLDANLTPVEHRHYVMNVLDDYNCSLVNWSNEKHSITYNNAHKFLNRFLGFFGVK